MLLLIYLHLDQGYNGVGHTPGGRWGKSWAGWGREAKLYVCLGEGVQNLCCVTGGGVWKYDFLPFLVHTGNIWMSPIALQKLIDGSLIYQPFNWYNLITSFQDYGKCQDIYLVEIQWPLKTYILESYSTVIERDMCKFIVNCFRTYEMRWTTSMMQEFQTSGEKFHGHQHQLDSGSQNS